MKESYYIPSLLMFVLHLGACSKIASVKIPDPSASSTTTAPPNSCQYRIEYHFAIPGVSNPSADFSASSIGGSTRILSSTCSGMPADQCGVLPAEHSLARNGNSLTLSQGGVTIATLQISQSSMGGVISDTCKGTLKSTHSVRSGVFTSSPKEWVITVDSIRGPSACPI